MLQSINPYTQKLIAEYVEHSTEALDSIARKAATAFLSWKKKSFADRASYFIKLAHILQSDKEAYGKLISSEMGKPLKEAIAEVEKCSNALNYYAQESVIFLHPVSIRTDAVESYIEYEPLGTVLALMPWNFPFWQVFRCAGPAMMAGNTVLLKLAPNTTGCALAIEEAFQKAGFPEGCFQTVKIQNETTNYLIAKKEIKAISLTGSERAGVIVAAEAGRQLKKVVLELGGSDPFIVLEDADLDRAVELAVKSRLQNTGQSCIAGKRFILQKVILEDFVSALILKLTALKTGDPLDPSTNIGPMARKDLKDGLTNQVKKSVEHGAKIIYGTLNTSEDNFFTPIVLSNVKPGMPAYEEELFGPVYSIIEVDSEEEAIRVANDSRYGLGASIWTEDTEKAKRLATQIESGMVFINDFVRSDARLPFGGVKLSGYGRELAEAGIKEFVNVKTVYVKG
jgi:succinate-semialdehyde dehydrogenase / glutarate-semialdehyde dehydrogenase